MINREQLRCEIDPFVMRVENTWADEIPITSASKQVLQTFTRASPSYYPYSRSFREPNNQNPTRTYWL